MSPKENLFISSITKDVGSLHPIEEMKNKLVNIMESFGFTYEEGPEIETEENNFDMLNIKKNHPARQMHDTFYVENRSFVLLELCLPAGTHRFCKALYALRGTFLPHL